MSRRGFNASATHSPVRHESSRGECRFLGPKRGPRGKMALRLCHARGYCSFGRSWTVLRAKPSSRVPLQRHAGMQTRQPCRFGWAVHAVPFGHEPTGSPGEPQTTACCGSAHDSRQEMLLKLPKSFRQQTAPSGQSFTPSHAAVMPSDPPSSHRVTKPSGRVESGKSRLQQLVGVIARVTPRHSTTGGMQAPAASHMETSSQKSFPQLRPSS